MEYAVYYHLGNEMDLKSAVHRGTLHLEDEELVIEGGPGFRCSYRDVIHAGQYFRLHFLCRMFEIPTRSGNIFLTVPLMEMFGKPIVTHFPRLQSLVGKLDPRVRRAWIRPSKVQPA